MNKSTLTTILFFILIACFFIPIVEWNSFEMSGMNFVLSSQTPDTKYILLLIPASSLLVLSKLIKAKELRYIPLCVAIILFVICYMETSEKAVLQIMDYGYWIMLMASLLLVFVKKEVKRY